MTFWMLKLRKLKLLLTDLPKCHLACMDIMLGNSLIWDLRHDKESMSSILFMTYIYISTDLYQVAEKNERAKIVPDRRVQNL
jgi:hypothetical protein